MKPKQTGLQNYIFMNIIVGYHHEKPGMKLCGSAEILLDTEETEGARGVS